MAQRRTIANPNDNRPRTCQCSPGCTYTGGTMTQAFLRFCDNNPSVLRHIISELENWKAADAGLCSIDMLVHHVRWLVNIEQGDGEFKISNSHVAFYARGVAWLRPDLAGLYRIKSAPEADAWYAHLRGENEAVA